MSENEKIIEMYIKQQQEKINELSHQLLMSTTKNKLLEENLKILELSNRQLQEKITYYENINKKKMNSVTGFKHNKTIIR